MLSKVWDEITYPFLNCCTVKVWEWINNFIHPFITDVITFPCKNKVKPGLQKGPLILLVNSLWSSVTIWWPIIWWRQDMETLFTRTWLQVTVAFWSQMISNTGLCVFHRCQLNKLLHKQKIFRWCICDGAVIFINSFHDSLIVSPKYDPFRWSVCLKGNTSEFVVTLLLACCRRPEAIGLQVVSFSTRIMSVLIPKELIMAERWPNQYTEKFILSPRVFKVLPIYGSCY